MKKNIFIAVLILGAVVCNAQKIGHMNSGNLLTLLPEVAKADTGIVLFQKDLMLTGDTLAKAFEAEYKVFIEAYNAGTLSQLQVQKRQAELQKQQQTLQAYAQQVDERVANLRKQLLQPILAKLDEAIRMLTDLRRWEDAKLFAQNAGQSDHRRNPIFQHRRYRLLVHRYDVQWRELLCAARVLHGRG